MKLSKILIAAALAMLTPAGLYAVTDKEMEQARTITAKAYLRYANDGSGYLDDVKVTTMTELEKVLKAKEQENLKAFKAVSVPGDYASWDKDKLVEYWSVTFFQSPGLTDKGKIAKSRVRKQVSAMNVAPAAKNEETPAPVAPVAEEKPQLAPEESQPAVTEDIPSASEVVQEEEDILADQKSISEDRQKAKSLDQEQSHTWVYVVILVILIAVVIWLVMYAAKVMKRQERRGGDSSDMIGSDNGVVRAEITELSTRLAEKNEELSRLNRRLQEEQERNADAIKNIERLKKDNRRLMEQLEMVKAQSSRESATVERPRREETVKEIPKTAAPEILKIIYLGRANSRGIFVRGDRRVNPEHTIYRLDTEDGLVGTFKVVDLPGVTKLALSAPEEYLSGGCMGKDLNDTEGVTAIVTESAGTAIFENGYWKVLRKSHIRYE